MRPIGLSDGTGASPAPAGLGEADLHARAAAASELSFTISDPRLPDNPLVWVNPAFERVTGYVASDVVGTNCRFLQGEGTDPEAIARISAAIRAGRTVAETLVNYRSDGTPFWNQVVISPILDAAGEVTHYVGIQADVTDRVEAQQAHDEALNAARADRARLAVLARVSEGLASNREYTAAVASLAETVVAETGGLGCGGHGQRARPGRAAARRGDRPGPARRGGRSGGPADHLVHPGAGRARGAAARGRPRAALPHRPRGARRAHHPRPSSRCWSAWASAPRWSCHCAPASAPSA